MFKKLIKWIVLLALVGAVVGLGGVAGIFYYYGRDLPEILTRDDFNPPQMTRIYSAEGEVIGEFFTPGAKRTVVPLEKIPAHVRHAFMAAEDADFMKHEGIDYLGMVRAFYLAARYDTGIKGTSTITQQVVKNLILTPEKAIERKVKEIILARELEKNLSKEDILFLYLNTIYLGHGVNGVEEAARLYFGKPVDQLSLGEGAVLAGLTQSPERHTPFRAPENALKRRDYVLKQLWEKGFIEEAAYRKTLELPIEVSDPAKSEPYLGVAPYFVDHVRRSLVDRYGADKVQGGGLRVHTTLRVEDQLAAQDAVHRGLHVYDARRDRYRAVEKVAAEKVEAWIAESAKRLGKKQLKKGEVYKAMITAVDAEESKLEVKIGGVEALVEVAPVARAVAAADDDKGKGKGEDEGEDAKKKEPALDDAFSRGHVVLVEVVDPAAEPAAARFAPGPESALVSIDPATRHVRALVGGYDFEFNEYNHATQMRRQTGSTFKPFVYAAALEEKIITPATVYLDSPAVFQMHGGKTWSPKNSDGSWRGAIRVREGLGASRNVIAVRVLKDVGIDKATAFARRMGVQSEMVDNFTMVMGSSELTPLEITNAYATFASGGRYAEPQFITRVESTRGETETFQPEFEQVLAPEVAFLVADLMSSVVHGYTDSHGRRRGGTAHSLAELGRTIAGKTGTTNESRDAWFIGFTPQLVTGVWVGYDDNSPLGAKEYGGRVAGPIWLSYMDSALQGEPEVEFEPPATGITTAQIDPKSGKLAREGGIEERFLTGTAPTEYAPSAEAAGTDDFLLRQFGGQDME